MFKMIMLVSALLSTMLLTSCGSAGIPRLEIDPALLEPAPLPALPAVGASNRAKAAYILAMEEWAETAQGQILTLANIVSVLAPKQ